MILLWALVAGARWATSFQESVTLPSGMQLGREFDWNRYGRWDLFATNGRTRLARDVEFVCFNDRYAFVKSYDRGSTGLYDAETDSRVPLDYSEAMEVSGLSKPGEGCDGYYTGWVGPGLLLDDGRPPFVPPCAWGNVENEALRDRAWFERPCRPAPWPPERQ
ncbi:hypothetical protein [Actibacterium sp. MT2.3-13A]|uniref:hypothetical protein n=1 Tax=Actibacterium sp. MT2.3-13A TaxID=2828332 RepID=UPI001BAB3782|nr:hypothetical protein [Actibacterium sp. MT2.3-13A]